MRKLILTVILLALSACAASNMSTGKEPWSQIAPPEQRQHVMLTSFYCGDNCYVRYRPLDQPETEARSALCAVGDCIAWMTEQSDASDFEQRPAIITLGTGKQYDGGGALMSDDFPAITSLDFDLPQ
jgi:hypothetical protein